MKCTKNHWIWNIKSGLDKTHWTNITQGHGTQNHHWLFKLHTGIQATLILYLSTPLTDCRALIIKWMQKLLSSYVVPGSGVWLDTKNALRVNTYNQIPRHISVLTLLMHWLQPQSSPCEALSSSWMGKVFAGSEGINCLHQSLGAGLLWYPTTQSILLATEKHGCKEAVNSCVAAYSQALIYKADSWLNVHCVFFFQETPWRFKITVNLNNIEILIISYNQTDF